MHVRFRQALALVVLVVLAHGLCLWGDFIWDDLDLIIRNPAIHASHGLWQFWLTTRNPDYFPLTSTMWWIEWRLWGTHPAGYHAINLLLHAASAVMIWLILLELELPGAWLAAAIWAVHPVQVESVAWIAEGKNTLSVALAAGSMLLLLLYYQFDLATDGAQIDTDKEKQKHGSYLCPSVPHPWLKFLLPALITFTLALLAKTAIAPLLLVMFGCAIWRGRPLRRSMIELIPFVAVTVGLCAVTIFFQSQRAIASDLVRSDGLASRIAIAGRALWFYLGKLVWPYPLAFVYPRWAIGDVSIRAILPLLLFLVAMLILWLLRRWRSLLAISFFVLMLLPVLGLINIYFMRYSLVADHWQYAASVGPIVIVAAVIARFRRPLQTVIASAILLLLICLSIKQTWLYHSAESLWLDTIAKNPTSWMARMNLGHTMIAEHRYPEGEQDYLAAAALAPDLADPLYSLGSAQAAQGNFSEALLQFQKALRIDPQFAVAYTDMAHCLVSLNRPDEAIASLEKEISLRPRDANVQCRFGELLEELHRPQDAVRAYESAIAVQPDLAIAQYNLGNCLLADKRFAEAEKHLRLAVSADPDSAAAHASLGFALMFQGKREEAAEEYAEARRIDPALASQSNQQR